MTDPPDEVRLRAANPGDLVPVQSLLEAARLPLGGLADQFGDGYVVAVKGERVVGVAGVERHGDYGLLRSVAVDPAERARGLGRELVRNRIEWARREALTALFLLTETATTFFERLGFARTDRNAAPTPIRASAEWREVCPQSATPMRFGPLA